MAGEIAFTELRDQPCSLIDLGSAYEFFDADSLAFLLGKDRNLAGRDWIAKERGENAADALFPTILKTTMQNQQSALRILEQLVVNDFLVLDAALLYSKARFPLPTDMLVQIIDSPWFKTCRIPTEVRKEAAEEIRRNSTALLHLNKTFEFHGGDKFAHDNLFEERNIERTYCFADSSDAAERALYYLTIARQASVPLSVGPVKQFQIEKFTESSLKGIHDYLSSLAVAPAQTNEAEAKSGFDAISAPLPPLQEMIILHAYRNGISPLEASKEIRSSTEAKGYRALIHELFQLLQGNLGDRNKAKGILEKIQAQMQTWEKHPGKRRWLTASELNIQKIPTIGWVAKMLGKFDKIPIPDVVISQSPAYVFMSRWFQTSR